MLYWVALPIKRMTDYRGRSRRREFWLFTLSMAVFWIALYFVADTLFPVTEGAGTEQIADGDEAKSVALSDDGKRLFNMLSWPFFLLFAVVHLPLSIRRLHDTGRTWWAYLVICLPYVGPFIMLWLFTKDSEPYGNQWGPDPKGRDRIDGFEGEGVESVPLPAARIRDV